MVAMASIDSHSLYDHPPLASSASINTLTTMKVKTSKGDLPFEWRWQVLRCQERGASIRLPCRQDGFGFRCLVCRSGESPWIDWRRTRWADEAEHLPFRCSTQVLHRIDLSAVCCLWHFASTDDDAIGRKWTMERKSQMTHLRHRHRRLNINRSSSLHSISCRWVLLFDNNSRLLFAMEVECWNDTECL